MQMITQIFPSRYTPFKTPVPVTAVGWQKLSSTSSCLVTGLQNGSIGVTWYYTPINASNAYSLTLSLNLGPITHIRCSYTNSYTAIADSNGILMLVNIKPPPEVKARVLTASNQTDTLTVGLNWSHDGTRLACLNANSQKGSPLTLLVYSNLSQAQVSHAKVSYPRHLVGQGVMHWERGTPSQRLVWSHDDTSIFITVPYHLLIEVSTQTWGITSRYVLFYSTQIHLLSPRQLLAIDTNKCLSLYHTSFSAVKELKFEVEHCVSHRERGLLLTVYNTARNGRHISILNLEQGHEVIDYRLPTADRVTSLSLSPDMSVLAYTTATELCSLVLYHTVPALSQLCMSILKGVNTTRLPDLLQRYTRTHHTVLCYPGDSREEIDLCVHKLRKIGMLGNKRTSLIVQKHHLGYNLEVARFAQSMKRNMKLTQQSLSENRFLSTLLDASLAAPPPDAKIKWDSAMTKFSIRSGGNKIKLRFRKGMTLILREQQLEMSVIHRHEDVDLYLSGEELAVIKQENKFFRITLHKRDLISPLQSLLIVLAYILRNF